MPSDIICYFATRLWDVQDLLSLRNIWGTWRKTLDYDFVEAACDPCLLLLSPVLEETEKIYSLSLIRALGASSARPEPVELGYSPGRICGTGYRWLVVIGQPTAIEFSVSLYNPLSECRLVLPSSASFVSALCQNTLLSAYGSAYATISLLEDSRSPASGCVVVISSSPHHRLSFLKYRPKNCNRRWTTVEVDSSSNECYTKLCVYHQNWVNTVGCNDFYTGYAYHQGYIVALRQSGVVDLVNLDTSVKIKVAPHHIQAGL